MEDFRESAVKALFDLTKKEDASYEDKYDAYKDGCEAAGKLALISNGYGHGRVRAAYDGLSKYGKKRLRVATAMCGHSFAMEELNRRRNDRGPRWFCDERDLASRKFAQEHDGVFFDYLRNEGVVSECDCAEHAPYVKMTLDERKAYGCSWLAGFMSAWENTHPTLRQIIFGEMLKVLKEEDGIFGFEIPRFPFI